MKTGGTSGAGAANDRRAMIQRRRDMERRKQQQRALGTSVQPTIKTAVKPLGMSLKFVNTTSSWTPDNDLEEEEAPETLTSFSGKENESKNSLEPVRAEVHKIVNPLESPQYQKPQFQQKLSPAMKTETEQNLKRTGVRDCYDPDEDFEDIPTEVLLTPPINSNNRKISAANNNCNNSRNNSIQEPPPPRIVDNYVNEEEKDNNNSNSPSRLRDNNNNNNNNRNRKNINRNSRSNSRSSDSRHRDSNISKDSYFHDDDDDGEYNSDEYHHHNDKHKPRGRNSSSLSNEGKLDESIKPSMESRTPSTPGASDEEASASEPITFATIEEKKSFLVRPCPIKYGVVQCYIERTKQGFRGSNCQYDVYLKDGNQYIMSGKKKAHNKTSNYYIASDRAGLEEQIGPTFLGKLRSNFMGTEFTIYGPGKNPKDLDADTLATTNALVRDERGVILYASNLLGSRGPRKMTVIFPRVKGDCEVKDFKPIKKKDGILAKYQKQDIKDLDFLHNKSPRWNEQVGAYVLNFSGRVTMASVKNFQLIRADDENNVILQFGRVGKDQFSMDFQYPLSPFQAFAICLSSFDNKILCE